MFQGSVQVHFSFYDVEAQIHRKAFDMITLGRVAGRRKMWRGLPEPRIELKTSAKIKSLPDDVTLIGETNEKKLSMWA